jgi:hypothetical protein
MKSLRLLLACAALVGCSKPADPSGRYVIANSWSSSEYDLQSGGLAKLSGTVIFAGLTSSWATSGTWKMDRNSLVISAPRPESIEPGHRVTEHRFTIQPNGDLVTVQGEEFDGGLRAVKQ